MLKKYILGFLFFFLPLVLPANDYCTAFQAYKNNDFTTAQEILDPMAFKGDTQAQNLLGLINLNAQNNAAAKKWLQSAAVKGHTKAAYNLGLFSYALGNNDQAEKWMHKAEVLTEAKMALGFLYTMKDMTKAKAYLYLAAQEGSSLAQSHLCVILVNNRIQSDDKYMHLCQENMTQASYETGRFYTSTKKYGSTEKAIHYLTYAAEQGHTKAMNLLGEMLAKRNAPMDQDNAMQYFLKAADKGNVDAKVNAAWYYYTGQRWTRDPKKGKIFLDSALEHSHPKAQFYMGVLYSKGLSFSGDTVKKDINKGWQYIKTSAAQNDPDALKYLIKHGVNLQKYTEQLRHYEMKQEEDKALRFLHDGC